MFPSEHDRRQHIGTDSLRRIVRRAGDASAVQRAHTHQLRHATGYAAVNAGKDLLLIQAYLGHRSIASTVRYTEVDAARFRTFWD